MNTVNKPISRRVESIDVIRGITIIVMLFVNDIAGVAGTPDWMKHMSPRIDGMTFVDIVFPAFLFIVGMSMPFSVGQRLEKGDSLLFTVKHILIRVLGLIIIGVLMVNSESAAENGLIDPHLWGLLMYMAVIVIWNKSSKENFLSKKPVWFGAVILLIILVILFRGYNFQAFRFPPPQEVKSSVSTDSQSSHQSDLKQESLSEVKPALPSDIQETPPADNKPAPLPEFKPPSPSDFKSIPLSGFQFIPSWWGILGLIGWAYLSASLFYIPFRKSDFGLLSSAVILYSFYLAAEAGMLSNFKWLTSFISPGPALGSHAGIVVTGILLGKKIKENLQEQNHKGILKWAFGFSILLFITGIFLHQLNSIDSMFMISKIKATVPWCLISSAITIWVWIFSYWLIDIKKIKGWTVIIEGAGTNPLFVYIIVPLFVEALFLLSYLFGGFNFYDWLGESFTTGFIRAIVLTMSMTWFVSFLSKKGIQLKL